MQILRQEGHQRPQEVAVRKEGAPPGKKEGTRKGLRKVASRTQGRARISEGKARTPRKARAPRQQGGLRDIRQWFERGSKPSQETPENQKECGSKEPQEKKGLDR